MGDSHSNRPVRSGKGVSDSPNFWSAMNIFVAIVALLSAVYANYETYTLSKENAEQAARSAQAAAEAVAISDRKGLFAETSFIQEQRNELLEAMQVKTPREVATNDSLRMILSDTFKPDWGISLEDIKSIGQVDAVAARSVAECRAELLTTESSVKNAYRLFNMDAPPDNNVRASLVALETGLAKSERFCKQAYSALDRLAEPTQIGEEERFNSFSDTRFEALERTALDLHRQPEADQSLR